MGSLKRSIATQLHQLPVTPAMGKGERRLLGAGEEARGAAGPTKRSSDGETAPPEFLPAMIYQKH